MIIPRIGRCQYCGQACAYCTQPVDSITEIEPMTTDAAELERVALAIEATMFAPHELPVPAEIHAKYLETAKAAIAAARPDREGWQEGMRAAMKVIDDMRVSGAGCFDPMHSGQRGEDRSTALYDAYHAIRRTVEQQAPERDK